MRKSLIGLFGISLFALIGVATYWNWQIIMSSRTLVPSLDRTEPTISDARRVPESQPDAAPPPTLMDVEELVANCDSSVCLVQSGTSVGTGFLVTPNLIATNKHVIKSSNSNSPVVVFQSASGQAIAADIAFVSPDRDLAILRIAAPNGMKPLSIHKKGEIKKGERILMIGNPGGMRNVVTQGILGSFQEMQGESWLQLSASINPGNSGGPVITSRGKVAGIVTLKSADQEGIGWAIPGDVILQALAEIEE